MGFMIIGYNDEPQCETALKERLRELREDKSDIDLD